MVNAYKNMFISGEYYFYTEPGLRDERAFALSSREYT